MAALEFDVIQSELFKGTLALFVILMDARRGIEDEERQLYEWLGTENVPAQIVFTKVDKLSV